MGKKNKFTKEEIEKIVKESYSIAEFCRKVGWKPRGDNYKTFHRYVNEYNIDTSHFSGIRSNIGNKNKTFKELSLNEYLKSKCVRGKTLIKKLIKEGVKEYKCECCGNSEWQGAPIALEVHHIDDNHFNNELDNIQLLCPNCHYLTENYRGRKNKNKKFCSVCGDEISRWSKSGLCFKCARTKSRVTTRPTADELIELLKQHSFCQIGKMYNVSDNAVRKWCKQYGIPYKAKDYS